MLTLIETTVIPAGHDAILAAIAAREDEIESLGVRSPLFLCRRHLEEMKREVLLQKAEAEEKAKQEAEQVTDADNLEKVASLVFPK